MFIFTVFFIFFSSIRVYKQSGHKRLLNLFINNPASPQAFAQSVHKQSAHKGLLNLFINSHPSSVCSTCSQTISPQGLAQAVHKQSGQKALLNLYEVIVVQKDLPNISMLFSAKSRIFSSTSVYPISSWKIKPKGLAQFVKNFQLLKMSI